MTSKRSRGAPTMTGVELTMSPSFHTLCTVAPPSTTLNIRSRNPVTCTPRVQLMMLVASFWAQAWRVMPRQPARVGSAVMSAAVMTALLVLLQCTTALPPRYGRMVIILAVLNSRVSSPALPPILPPLSRSAQVRMRRQELPPMLIVPDLGHVFEPSQVSPGLSSASLRPASQRGWRLLTPPVLKDMVWNGAVVSAMPSPATLPDAVPSSLKRSTTTLL